MSSILVDEDFIQCHRLTISSLPKLLICSSNYQIKHYEQKLFNQFGLPFPVDLEKAVVKRQAEYLAGRVCAKEALTLLSSEEKVVASDPNSRAPVWPQGFIGSITHTKQKAFAAVASDLNYKFVGIDYEDIMDVALAHDTSQQIVTEQELAWLEQDFEFYLTLIFSAKESLFKALYPTVHTYFDFLDAQISEINHQEQSFHIRLLKSLSSDLQQGACFKGYFRREKQSVLTLIAG